MAQLKVKSVGVDLSILTPGLDEKSILQFSSEDEFINVKWEPGLSSSNYGGTEIFLSLFLYSGTSTTDSINLAVRGHMTVTL